MEVHVNKSQLIKQVDMVTFRGADVSFLCSKTVGKQWTIPVIYLSGYLSICIF